MRQIVLALAAFASLALLACDGGDEDIDALPTETATETATSEATSSPEPTEGAETPTATEPPATATETAEPTPEATTEATPTATEPAGEADALAGVEAVLAAVEQGDAAAFAELMLMQEAPCTNVQGLGGPPKCWVGTTPDQARPQGTIVEVFPLSTCELEWRAEIEPIAEQVVREAEELFAVVRLNDPLIDAPEPWWPEASHAVMFEWSDEAGNEFGMVVALDEQGRVTFVDMSCVTPAADLLMGRYQDAEVVERGPAFDE